MSLSSSPPPLPFENRDNWPSGPWDTEPDRVQFWHAGLPCLLIRGPFGSWNGYVGLLALPDFHPLFGDYYGDLPFDAHGGLTYSGLDWEVQHIRWYGEGAPSGPVWYVGFDTNHFGDLAPGVLALLQSTHLHRPVLAHGTYRDLNYVRQQVEELADQIANYKEEPEHDELSGSE